MADMFIRGQNGYPDTGETIILIAMVYVAAGVVIVAPAWVINQVLLMIAKHAIAQAFRRKDRT